MQDTKSVCFSSKFKDFLCNALVFKCFFIFYLSYIVYPLIVTKVIVSNLLCPYTVITKDVKNLYYYYYDIWTIIIEIVRWLSWLNTCWDVCSIKKHRQIDILILLSSVIVFGCDVTSSYIQGGSSGIRQRTINWYTSPIIINKITLFIDLNYWLISLDTISFEPTKSSRRI